MQYINLIMFISIFFILFAGIFLLYLSDFYVITVSLFSTVCIFIIFSIFFYRNLILGIEYKDIIFEWISLPNLSINWSIYLDRLSLLMLLIVYSISLVVFIYSIDYMKNNKERARFFWLLLVFVFFMTLLIISNNLLQLFCGWEGVGLISYLLIGFDKKDNKAANSSVKAFIMNRIGDSCFIVAIILIYNIFGTLNFNLISENVIDKNFHIMNFFNLDITTIDLICFLIFIACMAKSAQFGFHTWLPDAMVGPTPVSALIHSATMVASGVFLIVRCAFLFKSSMIVSLFIMIVGSITALTFAIVAFWQNDLKRIIAYSTCSQLGYMMMACGAYDYTGAMFHLFTNAFAKSLLFLSSGIIVKIFGLRDIRSMDNIWTKHKLSCIFFWIGSLSLIGIFPFAGYFSKENLLFNVYYSKFGVLFFTIGVVAVFFTALYSLRVIFKISRSSVNKINSSNYFIGNLMSFSPIVLVFILLIFPIIKFTDLYNNQYFNNISSSINTNQNVIYMIKFLPLLVSLFGILAAYIIISKKCYFSKILSSDITNNKIFEFLSMDCIYNFFIVSRFKNLSFFISNSIDLGILDYFFSRLVSCCFNFSAMLVNLIHVTRLNHYLFIMFSGMVLLILLFL